MKSIIAIPTPNRFFAPWEFVESLLALRGRDIVIKAGALVHENRNELMKIAKGLNVDYILMIDSDMVFKPSDVETLEKHIADGADIVSGSCAKSDWDRPGYVELGKKGELIEVEAAGGGFLMISRKVIEAMEKPFSFIQELSEDRSFCYKARELGFKVYYDPQVKIGHIRSVVT